LTETGKQNPSAWDKKSRECGGGGVGPRKKRTRGTLRRQRANKDQGRKGGPYTTLSYKWGESVPKGLVGWEPISKSKGTRGEL